jgi:hypothetical protein
MEDRKQRERERTYTYGFLSFSPYYSFCTPSLLDGGDHIQRKSFPSSYFSPGTLLQTLIEMCFTNLLGTS